MASIGTWPIAVIPASCELDLMPNTRANAAPGGLSEQAVDLLNDRWVMRLTIPITKTADAPYLEALMDEFRGMVNTADVWHFGRATPRGTIAGTVLTNGTQAQGASSVALKGATVGTTLLAGDMLGISGQLLRVGIAGATADGSGNLTVPVVNRLRTALAANVSVTTTRPTATFRKLSHTPIRYNGHGLADEFEIVLGEVPA